MRTRLLLAAILTSATFGFQQPQAPAQPQPPAAPGTVEAITEASLRGHMEFLAGDALNGRKSATRDEWIAAEYIASNLRRWGLEPLGDFPAAGGGGRQGGAPAQPRGFVQRIELRSSEATAAPVINVGTLTLTHGKEMVVSSLGSIARTAGPLTVYKPGVIVKPGAAVLAPENATADDRAAMAAAAIIIAPETPQLRERWAQLASRMPAGGLRPVLLAPNTPNRPTSIVVDKATYAALVSQPAGARVFFDPPLKYSEPQYTYNVVARLMGTDPALRTDIVLLSAHHDHVGTQPNAQGDDKIFNGADDDASGSVAVMELARVIAEGPRPKRTIVFAWFGSEEIGGHGSTYFAELPVAPIPNIVANLQFEMIGRPDPKIAAKTLWLTGFERSNLGPELAKRGARLVADPYPDQQFFVRSDNIRFARKGIPAHTVSSYGLHTDYHQPADEVRLIDFPHMLEAIRSMVEPIRWLINDPWKPEWVPGGRPR